MKQRFVAVFCGLAAVFSLAVAGVAADGTVVYQKSCKMCHGTDGKGNAKLAVTLKVTTVQLDLTKAETQKKDDATLKKVTKDGVGKMKPMGSKLKDDEIAAVVAHLRTLAKAK